MQIWSVTTLNFLELCNLLRETLSCLLTQKFKSHLSNFFHNFKMSFFFKEEIISISSLLSYNFRGCEGAEFLFHTSTRVIYSLLQSITEFNHSIHSIPICQHKQIAYYIPRFTSGNILSRNWVSPPLGDRKSAKSWLLLSSGCCRSFFETKGTKEV